jgi:hypothetical protein
MNAQFHIEQCRTKIEVGGGVVQRIPAQDEKEIHFSGVQIVHQVAQAIRLVHGIRFERVRVVTVLPTFPSAAFIACASAWTNAGCCSPGYDQRRSTMLCRVFCGRKCAPFGGNLLRPGDSHRPAPKDLRRASCRAKPSEIARAKRQAVVRHRAGAGRHAFDDVQPVQFRRRPGSRFRREEKSRAYAHMARARC